MSKMLVAYKPCGCRAWAVLDMNAHPDVTAQSYAEAVVEGLDVREEERDRICALACQQHGGLAHVWDQGPMAYYCKRCGEVCAEEPPPRSGCKEVGSE